MSQPAPTRRPAPLLLAAAFFAACALVYLYSVLVARNPWRHPRTVVVDASRRFQTIEGFGTCTFPGDPVSAQTYATPAFEDMYVRDLGASLLRMEISPDLEPTADLDLGHLNVGRLRWDAPAATVNGGLARALAARRLDTFRLIASVWSPPAWMKASGSAVARAQPDGSLNDPGNVLRADREAHYGKYLAAFCQGFGARFGVSVYAVSVQNELTFDEPYNSCVYDPPRFHDTVGAIRRQFRRWGVTANLQGPEQVAAGPYFLSLNERFIRAVEDDPATASGLQQFALHGYAGDGVTVGGGRANLADFRQEVGGYGKEIWMTETSGEQPQWTHRAADGTEDGALRLGANLQEALTYGGCSAWLYWQCIDARPDTFALTTGTDTRAKKYCAAKHFFRYIRPGAVRVAATGDTDAFTVSAFVHDRDRTLTLVMVNTGDEPEAADVRLANGPAIASFREWRTSETESFARQPDAVVKDGRLAVLVPARSIATLYGNRDAPKSGRPAGS